MTDSFAENTADELAEDDSQTDNGTSKTGPNHVSISIEGGGLHRPDDSKSVI